MHAEQWINCQIARRLVLAECVEKIITYRTTCYPEG